MTLSYRQVQKLRFCSRKLFANREYFYLIISWRISWLLLYSYILHFEVRNVGNSSTGLHCDALKLLTGMVVSSL
jgi:hypothetical protein